MVTRVVRRLELRESWRAVVEWRHSAIDCRLVTVLYRTHNTSKNLACGVVNYMGDAYGTKFLGQYRIVALIYSSLVKRP